MILMISKNLYVEHIQSTLKAVKARFNIAIPNPDQDPDQELNSEIIGGI